MSTVVIAGASGGRSSGAARSMERSSVKRRGPVCGLRPLCCASIWYCGLPAIAPAVKAGWAGEGEAAATTAGEAEGAAGDAAGDAAADVAGETEATGWMAGLLVGPLVGLTVTVMVGGGGPD